MCRFPKTAPVALAAALAVLAPAPDAHAQQVGSIVGVLIDQMTSTPLVGASISVMDHELSAVTNEDGHFTIQGVPAGDVSVRLQHLGHITLVVQVDVPAQEVAFVSAELPPMALLLDELRVVTQPEPPQSRGAGAAIAEFRPTEAESAYTAMELLMARVPSLRLQGGESGSGARTDIRIRGSGSITGSNQPSIYIDGVKSDVEFLSELPAGDVLRVRVLRGPSASALYQDAVNGVILVETVRGRIPVKKRPGPPAH